MKFKQMAALLAAAALMLGLASGCGKKPDPIDPGSEDVSAGGDISGDTTEPSTDNTENSDSTTNTEGSTGPTTTAYQGNQGETWQGEEVDQTAGKITIWWPDTTDAKSILYQLILDFKKVYPNQQVEVVAKGPDMYTDLKAALAAKTQPDIAKLSHTYVAELARGDLVYDLDAFGASGKNVKDKYIPSTWEPITYKGKPYALPFDANVLTFSYNKDILKKAGVDAPNNWDELIKAGKAINAVQDQIDQFESAFTIPVAGDGIVGGWTAFVFCTYLWRLGGEVLSEDGMKATFNSEAGVKAMNMMLVETRENKLVKDDYYSTVEFLTGRVGFIEGGSWDIKDFVNPGRNADYGIGLMPELKAGVPRYSGMGMYGLSLVKNDKNAGNAKYAYEFMRHLATDEKYQVNYCSKLWQLPTLKGGYDYPEYQSELWKACRAQLEVSKARPNSPAWAEIEKAIDGACTAVVRGTPAQKALDSAAQVANKAIQKYA